ncbi:MAG: cysteine desulfurase family protein [Bdellovibrionales bacterium]
MTKPVYLDNNATTPIDPRVTESMLPYFQDKFGNASSANHTYGREAEKAVEEARRQVAQLLHCKPKEILFTSGATESNNLAIIGYLFNFICPSQSANESVHFITSTIEHKAVFEVGERLKTWGCEVTFLDPDEYGMIHPEQVEKAIRPNTKLVSIMWANNEIGTINPVEEIAKVCQKNDVLFHVDAAQAVGKIPIDLEKTSIDMLSLSAHKIYGPKGIGALYICERNPSIQITPFTVGGSQEKGIRPGTLNVPGIVGLGKACELCEAEGASDRERIFSLQQKIINTILKECPGARLNGHPKHRLYNNVSFSFGQLSADDFSLGLAGIALSSSSACSTQKGPSYVLQGIGLDNALAQATIRIGLGRFTSEKDVDFALEKIIGMHKKKHVTPNRAL